MAFFGKNSMIINLEYFETFHMEHFSLIKNIPKEVLRKVYLKEFKDGQVLLKKNSEIHDAYFVYSGQTEIMNEFINGKTYKFTKNRAPTLIGSHALFANKTIASVSVLALGPVKTIAIPRDVLLVWLKNDNSFCFWAANEMARNMYPISSNYGRHLLYNTVFIFTEILFDLIKEMLPNQVIEIRQSRDELSDLSGISVRSINRHITKLKSLGLIDIKKGKIVITTTQYRSLETFLEENQI